MTLNSGLGRLSTVPAREIWPHEAHDFTPWLLRNVDVLSDLLGMDLVLEVAEHPVGGFSLDLKGRDESTGETVIVENQLEVSDHTHLGQIITYAAGTDPTTVVWIATGFRPEHRAASDWLNQRTDERTRVFGVVIHVVRIGSSDPAPNFELVAQPNDREKQVKKATSAASGEANAKALGYRELWELVLDRIGERHRGTRARTSDQNWCDTPTGTSGAVISMSWTRVGLTAQLYFNSSDAEVNAARFEGLLARRDDFDRALGGPAGWDAMDGRKATRVVLPPRFLNLDNRTEWPQMAAWLIDAQERLRQALTAVGGVPLMVPADDVD